MERPILLIVVVVALLFMVSNYGSLKRWIIGKPMRSRELGAKHNKLLWYIALPILSADLYSSVAYGPEAGATELAFLGSRVKWLIVPIGLATVVLLAIVVVSYIMGIIAYPNGGGGYTIARDNFRRPLISLLALGALFIDYVLTVAVSVSSGIAAITSAYPSLGVDPVILSLVCLFLILMVTNRHGEPHCSH